MYCLFILVIRYLIWIINSYTETKCHFLTHCWKSRNYCNLKVNINLVACEAATNTGERTSQPQQHAAWFTVTDHVRQVKPTAPEETRSHNLSITLQVMCRALPDCPTGRVTSWRHKVEDLSCVWHPPVTPFRDKRKTDRTRTSYLYFNRGVVVTSIKESV